jgi:CRP/FNR family transcriptional regulator, nitrogen fixation regulation protein
MPTSSAPVGNIGVTTVMNDVGAAAIYTKLATNVFTYKKGTEIYGENEPVNYIYKVVRGAVRGCKLLSDGRRQIGAFYLPNDLFGTQNGRVHRFTAEAVVDTSVHLATRQSLDYLAETDTTVVRDLLRMATDSLRQAEQHVLLLGRKTAMERVAAFLLEMDRRLTATGRLALPMCRLDIADYLGLTIETVSRTISQFHDEGILDFAGANQREIVLRNRQHLLRLDR